MLVPRRNCSRLCKAQDEDADVKEPMPHNPANARNFRRLKGCVPGSIGNANLRLLI